MQEVYGKICQMIRIKSLFTLNLVAILEAISHASSISCIQINSFKQSNISLKTVKNKRDTNYLYKIQNMKSSEINYLANFYVERECIITSLSIWPSDQDLKT